MLYKFPERKNESHSAGYATVIILNGEANIDQGNNLQIALAERLGGQPIAHKKKVIQKKGDK